MTNIFPWIVANWPALLAVWASAHTLAVMIVNLTPTPKDDAAVAKIYGIFEMLAGIWTAKAKS